MYGEVLILSVPDTQEDILKKILKAVEGSIAIEKRTLPSEKIDRANLQILLTEKIVNWNGQEIPLNRHEFDTLVYLAGILAMYALKNKFMRQSGQRKWRIMKIQLYGTSAGAGRRLS